MALIDEQVQQSIAQREATASQFLERAKASAAQPPAGIPQQNVGLQGETKNPRGLLSGASGELGQIFNFFQEVKQRKGLRERAERFITIRERLVRESGATADERADPVRRAKFSLQAADVLGDPELTSRALDSVQKALTLQASRDSATTAAKLAQAKTAQAEATTAKTEAETKQIDPKAEALVKERIAKAELAEGKLADLKPAADDRATNAAARKLSSEAAMLRSKALSEKEAAEKARKIASPSLQKQVTQQLSGMPFMEDQDLEKGSPALLALQQMAFHVANSVEAQLRVAPSTPFNTTFNQGFKDFKQFMAPEEKATLLNLFGLLADDTTFNVEGAIGAGEQTREQQASTDIDSVTRDFQAGTISREEAVKRLKALGVKE